MFALLAHSHLSVEKLSIISVIEPLPFAGNWGYCKLVAIWRLGFERGHFLISGPIVQPLCRCRNQQNQEAAGRQIQLFSLSFSVYNFLKSYKTKSITRGFTGGERPELFLVLVLSVLCVQSSCLKHCVHHLWVRVRICLSQGWTTYPCQKFIGDS